MRRGEVRLVDPDPARSAEANERRPAVIVSNDGANATASRLGRGVVTVVPVTSGTARVYPFQVLLPAAATGLRVDAKAQAEQVRSVAVADDGRRRTALGCVRLGLWTRRLSPLLATSGHPGCSASPTAPVR